MHAFVEEFLLELKKLDCTVDRQIVYHPEIDSTSTELRRRLEAGSIAGTVVAAGHQTAGRGRSGRTWHSPAGGNLYVSLAVDLGGFQRKTVTTMPLAAGVAAWDAISEAESVELRLKWPNDVLMNGKKLAGILCEVASTKAGVAVVGLGVNLATEEFPDELSKTAVSLARKTGGQTPKSRISPAVIAARWVAGLESLMVKVRAGLDTEIITAWRSRAEPFGRRVSVNGIEGVTVELQDDGRLVVMKDNGERVTVTGGIVESI